MKLICHNDTRFTKEFAIGAKAPFLNLYKEDLKKIKKEGYTAVLTGFGRMKLIMKLEKHKINYFFIDRAYIIDDGKKEWMRVSYNSFQMKQMMHFPNWRNNLKIQPKKWNKNGDYILVIPPCSKAGRYWNFDHEKWLADTVFEIKKHSDRDILIRSRPPAIDRYNGEKSFSNVAKKAHIVVSYNSNAATEAIFQGTPALVLGEAASKFVAINQISKIEKPIRPNRTEWVKNLMYNQFTRKELTNGVALKTLMKIHNLK